MPGFGIIETGQAVSYTTIITIVHRNKILQRKTP